MLIHNRVSQSFRLSDIADSDEGVLTVVLKHKQREYKCALIACYLPPEHSSHGREPDQFFESVTQQLYTFNDCDDIVIAGDFNARTGGKLDYIVDVDEVPERHFLDHVSNKQGVSFIEFLRDVRYCIVNGRITHQSDKFTSISTKGVAVVDYVCVKYESIENVAECKVITVNDVIDEVRAMNPEFTPVRLSDHSIIFTTVRLWSPVFNPLNTNACDQTVSNPSINAGTAKPPKFKMNGVKERFMGSSVNATELVRLVDELLTLRREQEQVDQ